MSILSKKILAKELSMGMSSDYLDVMNGCFSKNWLKFLEKDLNKNFCFLFINLLSIKKSFLFKAIQPDVPMKFEVK